VELSRDGRTIMINSWDRDSCQLWDAVTGKPRGPAIPYERRWSHSMVLSPDALTVLTTVGGDKRLWDVESGKQVRQLIDKESAVSNASAVFSSDGRIVVTCGGSGMAKLWDAITGEQIGLPITHDGLVTSLAVSPDGRMVVIGGLKRAALWRLAADNHSGLPIDHLGIRPAAAFSHDGRFVVTGGRDNSARLWDANTGRPIGPPMHHISQIESLAFSPDGRRILVACEDKTTRLWNAATGHPIGTPIHHKAKINAMAFSQDSAEVITGSGGNVQCWVVDGAKPIGAPVDGDGVVAAVAFCPGGPRAVVGAPHVDPTPGIHLAPDLRLIDASTGKPVGSPMMARGVASDVVFSRDKRAVLIAAVPVNPIELPVMARLWDTATGKPLGPALEHQTPVCVALAPDGRTVLTGDLDGRARLWDAITGGLSGSPLEHRGRVTAVAFSPDGRTALTGSADKTARLWDAATGRPLGPAMTHEAWVSSVAFSPDGGTALTASGDAARLWDLGTLRDEPSRVPLWVEVRTGLEIDEQGEPRPRGNDAWRERSRIADLGGSPVLPSRRSLDPVLFGPEPTARARAFLDRQRWGEAGVAFDEAVRARPFNAEARLERGRFLSARGHGSRADDDFVEACALGHREPWLLDRLTDSEELFLRASSRSISVAHSLGVHRAERQAMLQRWFAAETACEVAVAASPETPDARRLLVLCLLSMGNRQAARKASAEMLESLGQTNDPEKAIQVVKIATIVHSDAKDPGIPVRLVESMLHDAVNSRDPRQRSKEIARESVRFMRNLGTALYVGLALYRAGRIGYLIRQFAHLPQAMRGGSNSVAIAESAQLRSTLGAALYRNHRFDDAIHYLIDGIPLRPGGDDPRSWAFLALAHSRLGHQDEAHRWLGRLRDRRPSKERSAFWDELEITLLRSEAEATILYDPIFPTDPFAK
jgi:WD40 repeat protein